MTSQPSEMQLVVPTGEHTAGGSDDDFGGESRSQGRQALSRFVRSPIAMTGLIFFVFIILASYIYPHFYRWKYNYRRRQGACRCRPGHQGHILGTDETGFDMLARLMRGTQRDFVIIVARPPSRCSSASSSASVAGYFGAVRRQLPDAHRRRHADRADL